MCSFLTKYRKKLKTLCRDFTSLSSFGRLFHSFAAAALKALSPIAILVLGMPKAKVLLYISIQQYFKKMFS